MGRGRSQPTLHPDPDCLRVRDQEMGDPPPPSVRDKAGQVLGIGRTGRGKPPLRGLPAPAPSPLAGLPVGTRRHLPGCSRGFNKTLGISPACLARVRGLGHLRPPLPPSQACLCRAGPQRPRVGLEPARPRAPGRWRGPRRRLRSRVIRPCGRLAQARGRAVRAPHGAPAPGAAGRPAVCSPRRGGAAAVTPTRAAGGGTRRSLSRSLAGRTHLARQVPWPRMLQRPRPGARGAERRGGHRPGKRICAAAATCAAGTRTGTAGTGRSGSAAPPAEWRTRRLPSRRCGRPSWRRRSGSWSGSARSSGAARGSARSAGGR